jgi:hypothetical protein
MWTVFYFWENDIVFSKILTHDDTYYEIIINYKYLFIVFLIIR